MIGDVAEEYFLKVVQSYLVKTNKAIMKRVEEGVDKKIQ